MRFRRTITLAPGFRLNLSGSGVSASVGPRGASTTFGRQGAFFNAGLPGTGLSSRHRLGSAPRTPAGPIGSNKVTVSARAYVDDDGEVRYVDANGNPLSDYLVDQAKRQQGPSIRGMLERACNEINDAGKKAAEIHLETPAPHDHPIYEPAPFEKAEPRAPALRPHGILERIFKGRARRLDEENAATIAAHQQQLVAWRSERDAFFANDARRKHFIEVELLSDVNAMAAGIEELLQGIEWPRETTVDFEIRDEGTKVLLDVDLPEIEDMPKRTASLPSRGYKITMRDIPASKIQRHYMAHVHAVGFRLIGEAFAALPTSQTVVLSAYSQRPDKATGAAVDEYLYSVRVTRERWEEIDFDNIEAIDVVHALTRFELRRDMSKTGIFTAITPFDD